MNSDIIRRRLFERNDCRYFKEPYQIYAKSLSTVMICTEFHCFPSCLLCFWCTNDGFWQNSIKEASVFRSCLLREESVRECDRRLVYICCCPSSWNKIFFSSLNDCVIYTHTHTHTHSHTHCQCCTRDWADEDKHSFLVSLISWGNLSDELFIGCVCVCVWLKDAYWWVVEWVWEEGFPCCMIHHLPHPHKGGISENPPAWELKEHRSKTCAQHELLVRFCSLQTHSSAPLSAFSALTLSEWVKLCKWSVKENPCLKMVNNASLQHHTELWLHAGISWEGKKQTLWIWGLSPSP